MSCIGFVNLSEIFQALAFIDSTIMNKVYYYYYILFYYYKLNLLSLTA